MANYIYSSLQCDNLKRKLRDAGVLTSGLVRGRFYKTLLNFQKCDRVEWQQIFSELSTRNRSGYTEIQLQNVNLFPVHFSENGSVMEWVTTWVDSETPAKFASLLLPSEQMTYLKIRENGKICKYSVENGNFTELFVSTKPSLPYKNKYAHTER